MEFRVIKADYKSKYHSSFCYNYNTKNIQYYIIQYKKDPSFFGLIKHDWETAVYNAQALASSRHNKIKVGKNAGTYVYPELDILAPGYDVAMEVLRLVKEKLGVDPGPRDGIVVYEEIHKGKKPSISSKELAHSYDELIEK